MIPPSGPGLIPTEEICLLNPTAFASHPLIKIVGAGLITLAINDYAIAITDVPGTI